MSARHESVIILRERACAGGAWEGRWGQLTSPAFPGIMVDPDGEQHVAAPTGLPRSWLSWRGLGFGRELLCLSEAPDATCKALSR